MARKRAMSPKGGPRLPTATRGKDQAHAIFRRQTRAKLEGEPIAPKCMEKDMDDMFWEIPQDQIMLALDRAHKKLKGVIFFMVQCSKRRT